MEAGHDAGHRICFPRGSERRRVDAVVKLNRKHAHADRRQEGGDEQDRDDHPPGRLGHIAAWILGLLREVGDGLYPGVGHHGDRDAGEEITPRRRHAEVDAVDDLVDLEQQYQAEDDQHELCDQVGEREHEVENAGFLDADDVDRNKERNQDDRRHDMRGLVAAQRIQKGDVLSEKAEVARCEIGGDRHRRGVVQELHPADDVADLGIEGPARKARAAACVGERRRPFRVVQSGRDKDESREDQGNRSQAQREGRGDPERVIDARADVAVTRREEGGSSEGPR